jgi:hypothetical protein
MIEYRQEGVEGAELLYRLATTILDHELATLYHERWEIGVSSQGHIVQSVRAKDSGLVAGRRHGAKARWRSPPTNILERSVMQRTRLQRAVNADVASLHEFPVVETFDNAQKQQELAETRPGRHPHRRRIGGDMVGEG